MNREKSYILVFENLKITSNILINDDIKLLKFSESDVENKLMDRHDSEKKWQRVFSAFEVTEELIKNSKIPPIVSTLIKLFKKGDVRFKCILQKASHLIRGDIYLPPRDISIQKYYENPLTIKNDSWAPYLINIDESDKFANFMNSNISPLLKMAHSCQMYNMVFSSPLHLKIPLLFFVIESFFYDVDSEVVFKISLYVTVLLKESESFRKEIKKLYNIRSKIAHGDLQGAENNIKKIELYDFETASNKVEEILNKLWIVLLSEQWDPKKSGDTMSSKLLNKENDI